MSFEITTNDRILRKVMDEITNTFEKENQDLLLQIAGFMVLDAKLYLQENNSIMSGALIQDVDVKEVKSDSVTVGTDLPYAVYVENGRGAFKMKDKVLHFFTKDGKEVFAKSVKMAKARPFLEPAAINAERDFPNVYVTEYDRKMKKMGAT